MDKGRNDHREYKLSFRVTDLEMKQIENKCRLYGMSVSELIRWSLFEKEITIHSYEEDMTDLLKKILGELGYIGNNLNQIARYLNSGGILTGEVLRKGRGAITKLHMTGEKLAAQFEEHYGNGKTHIK